MNKKIKIAYWVIGALNAIVCIVDIATANYWGAALSGITLIWLGSNYMLAKIIGEQDAHIKEWANEYYSMKDSLEKELSESLTREKLHHKEFAKMRERAQNAEIKLQQMIDDTPARGKDGRYVKRKVE